MWEQLGKELEGLFEEIKFIGVQYGEEKIICCFNCLKTQTTFCGNTFNDLKNKLENIRKKFSTSN